MIRYVAGLAFTNSALQCVALVHKNRGPSGVVGKWTGIGGKIEEGETPSEAMVREFAEETGIVIEIDQPFQIQRVVQG